MRAMDTIYGKWADSYDLLPTYQAELLRVVVAKMASHAIFQYNVLAIDDTHNTWTNMIVKMPFSGF